MNNGTPKGTSAEVPGQYMLSVFHWFKESFMMNFRNLVGVIMVTGSSAGWSGGGNMLEDARLDLATRLQVPVEQVSVISETERTWSDSSLGCPRKGMRYLQVISNGSELVLEVDGRHYHYHSGAGKPYFYCAVPAKKNGAPKGAPRQDI